MADKYKTTKDKMQFASAKHDPCGYVTDNPDPVAAAATGLLAGLLERMPPQSTDLDSRARFWRGYNLCRIFVGRATKDNCPLALAQAQAIERGI